MPLGPGFPEELDLTRREYLREAFLQEEMFRLRLGLLRLVCWEKSQLKPVFDPRGNTRWGCRIRADNPRVHSPAAPLLRPVRLDNQSGLQVPFGISPGLTPARCAVNIPIPTC